MSDLINGHITQLSGNNSIPGNGVTVEVNIKINEESKKEVEEILDKLERASYLYEKLAQIDVKVNES